MTTLKEKINQIKNAFKWQEEPKKIYVLNDKVDEELKSIILNPYTFKIDNYHYEWHADAMDIISDAIEDLEDISEIIQAIEDIEFYIEADTYTKDLTEWLNSNIERVYYLEDAIKEYGATDGFQILTFAQYAEKSGVYETARQNAIKYLQN